MIWITIVSIVVAVAACGVAWRAIREERLRSDARVALLAHDIHGSGFDLDLRSADRSAKASAERMFTSPAPSRSGSQLGLALAIGGFVAASIGAAAIVLSGAPQTTAPAATDSSPTSAAAPSSRRADGADARSAAPLELVALAHERDGDTLTIRGTIRNPPSGLEMNRLTAVVFLFDRDGAFLASGRSPVDSPALIPGGESTFLVTVPAAGDVARYRVSFRSGDRIVSHIDKRSGA